MSIPRETAIDTAGAAAPERGIPVREGILEIPGEIALYHGGRLPGMRVAWRMAGPASAPVVVALGGISAHRRVFVPNDPRQGWWGEVVGPAGALDARTLRILSFDYLGGSQDSTGPRAGEPFPSLSSYDQADALLRLMNHLGIKALHGIVGASYGGMVALAFAERYPDRVLAIVAISAADRPHPMATAWRSIQRRIATLGASCGRAAEGLELARAIGMTTYRSAEEFAARFDGPAREIDGRWQFPVEEYLLARGRDYAIRYTPEAFCCLSESIDLHRVDASRIFVPVTAVAVTEDRLVPLADMRAVAARLPRARLCEISSIYGHDAFLKEAEQLQPIFAHALGCAA
jgi:homoserine O-acetyltransferase